MNLSRNKVVAGVIGLLAIVSIVNTQSILSLANYVKGDRVEKSVVISGEGQEAQTLLAFPSSLSSGNKRPFSNVRNSCIQIQKSTTNPTLYYDDSFESLFGGVYREYLYFNLKNVCTYPVSLVVPGPDYSSDPLLAGFPSDHSFSSPYAPSVIEDQNGSISSHTNTHGFSGGFGLYTTANITNISASNTSGILPYPTTYGFRTVEILPGQVLAVGSNVATTENPQLEETVTLRFSLRQLKWFKTSDYTDDSMLSANEVKTFRIPDEIKDDYRSEYFTFGDPEFGGNPNKSSLVDIPDVKYKELNKTR